MKVKFRRRKYINDTKLQMKFVSSFVIVCILSSILTSVVFNYLALIKLESLMWSTHINIKSTDELLRPLFININIINLLFVAALLIVTGLWLIRKITGPLYRMQKDIRKIATGDLSAGMTLRQKDELKDIAYELNIMIKSIRDRFAAINEKYADISESVKVLKADAGDMDASAADYKSVLTKIETLEMELNRFKL
jgi:methyl-accepting chemotaxis protein